MSNGTDHIAAEIIRIKALADHAHSVGDYHEYRHHNTHHEMWKVLHEVLVDLQDRVTALE